MSSGISLHTRFSMRCFAFSSFRTLALSCSKAEKNPTLPGVPCTRHSTPSNEQRSGHDGPAIISATCRQKTQHRLSLESREQSSHSDTSNQAASTPKRSGPNLGGFTPGARSNAPPNADRAPWARACRPAQQVPAGGAPNFHYKKPRPKSKAWV